MSATYSKKSASHAVDRVMESLRLNEGYESARKVQDHIKERGQTLNSAQDRYDDRDTRRFNPTREPWFSESIDRAQYKRSHKDPKRDQYDKGYGQSYSAGYGNTFGGADDFYLPKCRHDHYARDQPLGTIRHEKSSKGHNVYQPRDYKSSYGEVYGKEYGTAFAYPDIFEPGRRDPYRYSRRAHSR